MVFLPRPLRREVSKGVEDSRRLPALWGGPPRNSRQAVLGVARLQGIKWSGMVGPGMAGPGETLGSPWIPHAIGACVFPMLPSVLVRMATYPHFFPIFACPWLMIFCSGWPPILIS
jgi:hypothetical protein